MATDDMQPGTRIGAILSAKDGTVRFLGFGCYEGHFLPPGVSIPSFDDVVSQMGELSEAKLEELRGLYNQHYGPNGAMLRLRQSPRLRLDNGDAVWGGECHWDHEADVRTQLHGKQITHVRLVRNGDGRVHEVIELQEQTVTSPS